MIKSRPRRLWLQGPWHTKAIHHGGAPLAKTSPQLVEVADLSEVTHDPLLASLRQRLRQRHGGARKGKMNVICVFSREGRVAASRCL